MKIHPLITTTEALAAICARLAKSEFHRLIPSSCARTPIGPNCAWCRSPTRKRRPPSTRSPGDRPVPLLDLLVDNEDVLKVFHAGGQDVEIIYNLTGRTPHPIFDTQIAMMAIAERADRLFQPRRGLAGADHRQGRALYRLVAPPAHRAADRICDRRRDPSVEDLPAILSG
jgi:hypothetical protein